MAKERDDKLDPTQPTLIVKNGNTQRKYRRLEKDALVLGRAAGCDVGLEAPDVAPVHCVIVRTADGWRVRDCTNRGGTRVNGRSVQDDILADEDVLQIGSFSFAVHLPASRSRLAAPCGRTDDAAVNRLQRSRQNLGRLALRLRGRLRDASKEITERVEEQLAGRQEELDRQAEELDALQSDLDARLGELRQTRQAIGAETRALLERNEQVEKEIAQQRAESEAALASSLEEHQARCREAEDAHARTLADQRRTYEESVGDAPRRLEIRAQELSAYSAHLRRARQRLCDHEESLAVRWQEWLREQQTASEQSAREEALIRDQRSEVVRLMGEMRQLRQVPRPAPADADALRQENEQLRQTLAAAHDEAKQRAAEADELRGRLESAGRRDVAAPDHRPFELDEDGPGLDKQIRAMQDQYAGLEQAAREAHAQITRERARIDRELATLEYLRGSLRPTEGRSPTQDTVVDMPSPFRQLTEAARDLEQTAATTTANG